VKIDIHTQLLKWRQEITAEGHAPRWKKLMMQVSAFVLKHPLLYRFSGWFARRGLPLANLLRLDPWTASRDLPQAPEQTFRAWHRKNKL
jgi:L-lactate dehydrogenase complex protein LldF